MQQEGHRLDAAGALYVPLTDNKRPNPITPLPLSVETPVDKRNLSVEKRFKVIYLTLESCHYGRTEFNFLSVF